MIFSVSHGFIVVLSEKSKVGSNSHLSFVLHQYEYIIPVPYHFPDKCYCLLKLKFSHTYFIKKGLHFCNLMFMCCFICTTLHLSVINIPEPSLDSSKVTKSNPNSVSKPPSPTVKTIHWKH